MSNLNLPAAQSCVAATPLAEGLSASVLCGAIETLVAAAFAVPASELRAATRRAPATAFARQGAMYLAHVAAGLTFTEIGRAFGRDRTTAAHACSVIEERRENPRVDALFCVLEVACARHIGGCSGDAVRQ